MLLGLAAALVPALRAARTSPAVATRSRSRAAEGGASIAPALKVLIVDDQPAVRAALRLLFEVHGLPRGRVDSPDEALT